MRSALLVGFAGRVGGFVGGRLGTAKRSTAARTLTTMPRTTRSGTPAQQAAQLLKEHRAAQRRASQPKRYLVLGAEGFGPPVNAYRWDKIPDGTNVSDFDVVVLNYAPFEEPTFAQTFRPERLPTDAAMTRMLFSAGTDIIAIGNPASLVGAAPPEDMPRAQDDRVAVSGWLPCWLEISQEEGAAYDVADDSLWAPWFEMLNGWRWFATGVMRWRYRDLRDYLTPVTTDADDMTVETAAIALTRFGKAIGLELRFDATQTYRYNPPGGPAVSGGLLEGKHTIASSTTVTWLPTPDKLPVKDAITMLLRERHGVGDVPATAPDWVNAYMLPQQEEAIGEVERLIEERSHVEQRLRDAQDRVTETERPRLMLYEKGKDILEPVVRDALRALGARVVVPERAGVEDARIYFGDRAAAVEIKGTKNAIGLEHVRQVAQWANDAKLDDGREHKALIVGNPFCERPLGERENPLAPNAATLARNGRVALVTTSQLYEALRKQQAGSFDEGVFWDRVFAAIGLAELPSIAG
jgi:hypothetical protein